MANSNYYVKSVVPIIESHYHAFTPVETTIADFFIANQTNQDFSAKHISELLFVSEASLSRFAKKCGYKGYREFVYQYAEALSKTVAPKNDNSIAVLDTYQELLNKTYALVDYEQVARICQYLHLARRVLVAGQGSSGFAAREMELRFMRIGVPIDSLHDGDMIRMQGIFQNEENLVIGFSISGEREEILYLLQESHNRGAKTVLVTSKKIEMHTKYCDEILVLPYLKYLDYGNLISPQFPILIVIDMLYAYCTNEGGFAKMELHEQTVTALKQERRQRSDL